MSDVPQGPGWWLDSDLKWYSPEQRPGEATPPAPPTPLATAHTVAPTPPAVLLPTSGLDSSIPEGASAPGLAPRRSRRVPPAAPPTPRDEALEKVRRLGELRDSGRISEGEFQMMSNDILNP
jgi:hypothetical protein